MIRFNQDILIHIYLLTDFSYLCTILLLRSDVLYLKKKKKKKKMGEISLKVTSGKYSKNRIANGLKISFYPIK